MDPELGGIRPDTSALNRLDNRMPLWMHGARVVAVMAVAVGVLGSTVAQDAPGQTARGLQQFYSWTHERGTSACQYAVEHKEDAIAKRLDPSVPGTTINVTSLDYGRLGNHFTTASRFLSLGYCCKAKLLTLPPKDPVLAPGVFGKGFPGPRHFDFSDTPDVPGFNSSIKCNENYTMGGEDAYRAFLAQDGLPYGRMKKKELALCVRSVRLLDCEAAYYFPQSLDVCRVPDSPASAVVSNGRVAESVSEKPGNLVIHVRSGDVFRHRKAYLSYGQPPLSYYVGVMNSREWNRVDLVTYAPEPRDENPVVPALRMLAVMGTWPNTDFNIHVDRNIEVDLQAMLCADALATSRSTLGELTMYHTRANTIFLSSTCDGYGSVFGHISGRLLTAGSLRDEPIQVHGVKLRPEAPPYKLYESRTFTDAERLEMLEYQGLAGMEECTSPDQDVDRWDSVSSSRSPLGNAPQ